MENTNSNTIPFKVSARTARLIGRENIANAKGAIIELVKNSYDADSKVCIVYFDNRYSTLLSEISDSHFQNLIKLGVSEELLNDIYLRQESEDNYLLKNVIDDEKKILFKNRISKFASLYIIDFGEGMTQNIIRDHWMTIGTDNKVNDIFTKQGMVKSGAKGIGRFALDKLGSKCEMITIFNPDPLIHKPDTDIEGNLTNYKGYNWVVNWEDFEGDYKTIDKVGAILTGITTDHLKGELIAKIPTIDLSKIESEKDFKYGTILKINELRDNWEDYFVDQVYSDLEVLVPPKEAGGFEIYVYSSLMPNKYGEVLGSVCDDYDYKLVASADENQNVKIKIYRNEYDIELIPNDFFDREAMQKENFRKSDFIKGYWEKTTTYSELIKGFKEVDEDDTFKNIGVFNFTFYFLKRQPSPDRDYAFKKSLFLN